MKLENFKLNAEHHGTELIESGGRLWDLHNAQFSGVRYEVLENGISRVEMKWVPAKDSTGHPWGDPKNQAKSCALLFDQVGRFSIEKGSAEKETGALQLVSKSDPNNREFPQRESWEGLEFSLLFEFESGLRIQISADSVRVSEAKNLHVMPSKTS